tara:strand:- start:15 stop:539 length:525 start_codon:yes stop_codon:yes gene_type:complete
MRDQIQVNVTPKIEREGSGSTAMNFKIPGVKLNIDDILIVGFEGATVTIKEEFVPPSAGLPAASTAYAKVMMPQIWTKSQFYGGATNNLGIKNPLKWQVGESFEQGGNPMTASNSPLWDHVSDDEQDAESYLNPGTYNIYEECVSAVLSEPGSGVATVQNLWSETCKNLEYQRC